MDTKLFKYEGRNLGGEVISGKLEAGSVDDVVFHLKKQNITPTNIEEVKGGAVGGHRSLFSFTFTLHKIEPYHIMNFCRQLALLNDTGIPIVKAIRKLSVSSTSSGLRSILEVVANDISAGMTLSAALKKHPSAFSAIVYNIVEVGENTGNLSEVLVYLSHYIESTIKNRRRLLSAVRYPTFVFLTALLSILVMNFLVIPKFAQMFAKFDMDLPLATRFIIGTSEFLINNKIAIIVVAIVIIVGTNRVLRVPGVRYVWDKKKLDIPIFGQLIRRITVSQFTWTFSLILRSGVPIIRGLGLASHSTGNVYFQNRILKMSEAIEHGENLSGAAINSGLFTPITIQMIEVGEESEKLDETLSEISRYYDSEIDYDLKRLNELMEPILLAIIGFMIATVALGVYFPMWDLIKIAQV